jgi:hypothetical protein
MDRDVLDRLSLGPDQLPGSRQQHHIETIFHLHWNSGSLTLLNPDWPDPENRSSSYESRFLVCALAAYRSGRQGVWPQERTGQRVGNPLLVALR